MGHPESFMRYNFAAMDQMTADMGAGVNKLESMLGELDRTARPMVATWSGDAQVAYSFRQATWTASAHALKECLQRMQNAVGESRTMMMSTNNKAANLFSA